MQDLEINNAQRNNIRQIPFLEGEKPVKFFSPDAGISEIPASVGDLMTLTTQRLIVFRDINGYTESRIAMLDDIGSVGLRQSNNTTKPLYQGLSFIFLGILAFLILGTISTGTIVTALLSGAIVLLGILVILKYAITKPSGELIIHTSSSEIVFPFHDQDVGLQAHWFVSTLFRFKYLRTDNAQVVEVQGNPDVQSDRINDEHASQISGDATFEIFNPNLNPDQHLSLESKLDHDLDGNSRTQQP